MVSDRETWLQSENLLTTKQTLRGPGGTLLPVMGVIKARLRHRNESLDELVYVIRNQEYSLLSRRACVCLNLVARVDNVQENMSDKPNFRTEFGSLFKGIGKLKTEHHITLCADATPVCLYTARKIAHPLLPQIKSEIESMVRQEIISPVTVPTRWCSGMVPVQKANGTVRICVDLTHLNKSVQREIHPMSSVDESLAKLGNSKVFSKLDANSGFWQLPLDDESRLLTTFITPHGRYCFNRLPFGISSAPEIFQRTMSQILEDLEGVICHMDDILIHAADQAEHDKRVRAVLVRIQEAGLTLNTIKCQFSRSSLTFLGHIIDGSGIQADPRKTTAIKNFPTPTTVKELQRFMGMVNQMSKFIPELAECNDPLRQLLRSDSVWSWADAQDISFQRVKDTLIAPETLAHYDPNRPTIIAADASSTGIGAVLLQVQDDYKRRPVCYASRSLSDTEKRYAVIEKEALAATWACEKFSEYVLGSKLTLETDHRPLVPLLNSTELCKMPPRIQRLRLRLMRFAPLVQYVPGKLQTTADALSRAPVESPATEDDLFVAEVEAFASRVVNILPATDKRLQEIINNQKVDEECSEIREYCLHGWPAYKTQQPLLGQYWESQSHLAIVDDILLYDERIVIPRAMRLDILDCIHQGHQGITKCRARARTSVWWPGLSTMIEQMVSKCVTCAKDRPVPTEPLMASSFPSRPWERLAMDLFEIHGKVYLIVIDYYSRWIESKRLDNLSSESVVYVLKEIFVSHGIPDIIISDNGPQFSAATFRQFAMNYGFVHVTSSPRYPQSNGEAERAVRTMKGLLKRNDDQHIALMVYRSTPLQNGLSPAEMIMGRRLRTQLPILPNALKPRDSHGESLERKEGQQRSDQQRNFNLRHNARDLSTLQPGDPVWIRDQNRQGQVVSRTPEPRSYLVRTDLGTVRRNRRALVPTSRDTDVSNGRLTPPARVRATSDITTPTVEMQPPATPARSVSHPPLAELAAPDRVTRSGRIVKPPKRLDL